jgi:hypothetical protein
MPRCWSATFYSDASSPGEGRGFTWVSTSDQVAGQRRKEEAWTKWGEAAFS